MQAVLESDTDYDFTLSKNELRRLRTRLSNIPGVTFDKDNIKKLCGGGRSDEEDNHDLQLKDIMAMFHNLKEDIPEKDNIFHLTPENLL